MLRNIISVDVEEYFHPTEVAAFVSMEKWAKLPSRVEPQTQRVLDIFDRHQVKGTFFVLGWVARYYPGLIREIANRGGAVRLLEPIMKVEVVTPEEYLGGVIGDLNSRRGHVHGTDNRGNAQVITAMVPLANMFGYVNTLRSMSQGRAQYTMQFDHYEQVPQAIAEEVKAKYA